MKQKHTVRATALLLALLMLAGNLAACSESQTNQESGESASADTVSGAIDETVPEETGPELPKADYEGYEVSILNNISNFAYTNIGEEGLTGESLDDEIFNRNKRVEEELNVTFKIEKKEYYETNDIINKIVPAGDDVYDFYTFDLNMMVSHVLNGYDLDVTDIESLDLDQYWWDKKATDSVSVGDAIYSFFGDLHTGYMEGHGVIAFNKNMLTNLGLSNPYDYAYEGTWTLDVLIDMVNKAKIDTNGDGKWTVDDQYGFSMFQDNWPISLIAGSNQFFMQKDENNIPVWNGLTEQYYNAYTKIATTLFSDPTNNANCATGTLPGELEFFRQMFALERSLFLIANVGILKDMRDVEFEMGVVPMPKYDETQENYVSLIFQGANAFAIPVTNDDPERTGMILNHLAARSTDTVRKVYVDETLDFKYISDKEGQDMMDIVLSTGVFDFAAVNDWNTIADTVIKQIKLGNADLASQIAKTEKIINKKLEIIIEGFNSIGK